MTTRFAVLAAFAAGLAAAAPTPASAQVGGLIKQKVKQKVGQTITGTDTASAAMKAGAGPKFTEAVLEITPELLDRLEKGLAAEATVRAEVSAQIGKVLTPQAYDACRQAWVIGPEGEKFSEETLKKVENATTPEQLEKVTLELAARLEELLKPECGLEPGKAEELRRQLAGRPAAAAQDASELSRVQLSILKERILPFCAAAQPVSASTGGVRIPTEYQAIFWVYAAGEVNALKPRCGKLVAALQAGG